MRADHVQLQQVILNLAVNGMDAMQNCATGDGRMSIQTALVGKSEVEVQVADSGMGIPADKLSQVFDTFYTTKRMGTGLGLSISRAIVETYGGRIWAGNLPAGGNGVPFHPAVVQGSLRVMNAPGSGWCTGASQATWDRPERRCGLSRADPNIFNE